MMWEFIKKTHAGLRDKKRKEQFLIFLSFFITFIVARFVANLQFQDVLPFFIVNDIHVHHLVFGIVFLIVSGYVGIVYGYKEHLKSLTAIIFGIGAALTVDEFTLWLFLDENYWDEIGRYNVDIVIILTVVFFLIYLIGEAHDWRLFRKLNK